MIYIGADHRGFELKERLKKRLSDEGLEISDLGNDHFDPQDDYVDFAKSVADATRNSPGNIGILLCGSGAGMDMAANKFKGIRSALVMDKQRAVQARQHEDANILSLPSDILDESQAYEIVKSFLETDFSGEDRHKRRLQKMVEIENNS